MDFPQLKIAVCGGIVLYYMLWRTSKTVTQDCQPARL